MVRGTRRTAEVKLHGIAAACFRYWVLRTASDGSLLWSRGYGIPIDAHLRHGPNGGMLVVGVFDGSGNVFDGRPILMRLDPDGSAAWSRFYDREDFADELLDAALSGGVLVAAGLTRDFGRIEGSAWAVGFDPDGEVLWQHVYAPEQLGGFSRVVSMRDDRVSLVGWLGEKIGEASPWLVMLDPRSARILRQVTVGARGSDSILDALEGRSDDLFLTGATRRVSGTADLFILRAPRDLRGIGSCVPARPTFVEGVVTTAAFTEPIVDAGEFAPPFLRPERTEVPGEELWIVEPCSATDALSPLSTRKMRVPGR